MPVITEGRHAVMRDLVDVKGEFGPHMLVFAFGVADHRSVFRTQFWEFYRYGAVGGFGVSYRIGNVMRERTDGEGKLVRVARIAKQVEHKVAGANVVGEVRKRLVAERIIADVLNRAASVGIRARTIKISNRQIRIPAHQQRNDRVLPGKVDELLVRQQRISDGLPIDGK